MPGTSPELAALARTKVPVPTAVALFPADITFAPRAWCKQSYTLQRYTAFARGGHFASLEQPGPLVEDVRGCAPTRATGCRAQRRPVHKALHISFMTLYA